MKYNIGDLFSVKYQYIPHYGAITILDIKEDKYKIHYIYSQAPGVITVDDLVVDESYFDIMTSHGYIHFSVK